MALYIYLWLDKLRAFMSSKIISIEHHGYSWFLYQGSINMKGGFILKYFVGVDIAKETHYATIINEFNSIVVPAFPFTNDKNGFNLFLSKVKNYSKSDLLIGFESTAHYHQNLYSHSLLQTKMQCL